MRFLPGPARVPLGPESRNNVEMLSVKIAGITTRTKRLLLISALGAFAPATLAAEPNFRQADVTRSWKGPVVSVP